MERPPDAEQPRGNNDPRRVVVGSFTPSVVLEVARVTGRLSDHGLDVLEVPVASSPAQFRSLLDGELDLALTSPDNVIAYRFSPTNPLGRTADVRMLGAVDRGLGLGLYGRPGMRPEDLRGATVGVDVPASGFALALYALADSLGLARADYTLVNLGSTPKRLAALLAGQCDATMLNAGNELVAEESGCVLLAPVGAVCPTYLGTVLATRGDDADGVGGKLLAALGKTAVALVTGDVEHEAVEVAGRVLSLGPHLARRYVARLRDPEQGLVPDGQVDSASLEALVGLRRRWLPEPVAGADGDHGGDGEDADGADVVDAALDPSSGVLDPPPRL